MALTKLEKEIIKVIAKHTPFNEMDVFKIWDRCNKSYDKTIYCLNKSKQLGILPDDLCT